MIIFYQKLFRRKKSSWPRAALDLAWAEKGEVIPDKKATFFFLSRTTIEPSVRIRGPNCKGWKNLN